MKIKLRDYQQDALNKLEWDRKQPGNSLVVIPQGGGKSHVIASYIEMLDQSVVILQPTREVLKQNHSKFVALLPHEDVGIFSASLNQKQVGRVTFATVQSVYNVPELFKHCKVLIIDEADLLNPRKANMYKTFIKEADFEKVIGFTGTPYRMVQRTRSYGSNFWEKESYTVTELINRIFPIFWKRILYSITTQELVKKGFLSPIRYVDSTLLDHEKIPVNKSKSDFDLKGYWKEIKEMRLAEKINTIQDEFKSVLVFCSSIEEAEGLLEDCFEGKKTAIITHKTKSGDRAQIVKDFKDGKIYAVFNVQTLTVGFDHPGLDCIILTRPTRSIRLYNQMIGRGTRISDGKTHCTVIDFSGTVKALGRLETFRIEQIDGRWELLSEKGSWHNKELYSFKLPIAPPKAKDEPELPLDM